MNYDCIIVGAGAAGLMAAMVAADLGAKILLLERHDGSGSDLALGGGLPSAAGTRFQSTLGIEDSPDTWLKDIEGKTGGKFDRFIASLVAARSADAMHYLADKAGLPILCAARIPVPGHSVPRLHSTPGESGRELTELMRNAAAARNTVERRDHARVTSLIVEEDIVRGVRADIDGVEHEFHGRHVLLACGGFAANRDMLARFIPEVVDAIHIGSRYNTGDAFDWARPLGARIGYMDAYQGHGHVTADGKGRLGLGLTSFGAILVNSEGQRFVREDVGPSELAQYILACPGREAIEVYDKRVHEAALGMAAYRNVVESGKVITADSVSSFASALDLPEEAFRRTLESYNEALAGNAADPMGRSGFGNPEPLRPPLMGVKVTGALAHTQGGLSVDANARVLREDGSVIAGLLAAGGCVVGISGHGAAGYSSGNGLAHAFALGMIAAETACAAMEG